MLKQLFIYALTIFFTTNLFAQKPTSPSLLKSFPISVTPLSLWDSDISAAAGVEYRFHPSFSVRLVTDYIYGNYSIERANTSGIRIREELRYYIAGNRLIASRSKAWPYFSVAFGNKWVKTKMPNWYSRTLNDQTYSIWQSFTTHNKEWHIMGRTGMQTVFGRQKRFLFDFSMGVGVSNSNVSFTFDDESMKQEVLARYSHDNNYDGSSHNKFSGRFTGFNFEACFGYRLLGK